MSPLKTVAVALMLFGVVLSAPAKVNLRKNVASTNKEKLLKRLRSAFHEVDKQQAKQQNDVKARQWPNMADMAYDSAYGTEPAAGYTGYDSTDIGHQTGYHSADTGHHAGYDSADMGHQTGYHSADTGHQTGYDSAGMEHQTGYDSADMGHQAGFDSADMGPQTGYHSADMEHQTGYNSADMGHQTGFHSADMGHMGSDAGSYPTGMVHDTGYHAAPFDKNLMTREQVIDFFYDVFMKAMEESVWKLYEEERCQGEIDIPSEYKFSASDTKDSLFQKMKISFRDLIKEVNMCSGEEVHSQKDAEAMIELAEMVYIEYNQYAGVEELEYYYGMGKDEAMSHSDKWSEECRLFISALDCNMEHLHEEMMYFLKK